MLKTYAMVTAVIRNNGRFLIAKRADTKYFAPGTWEFISGFMDTIGSAEEIILKEIHEELGVQGTVLASAPAFEMNDAEGRWVAIPFLVTLNMTDVHPIPGEHSELRWVTAAELEKYADLQPFMESQSMKSLLISTN